MIPRLPFFFMRHGETDYNLRNRMQGFADIPLNSRGESQANAARVVAAGLGLKSIATSPLIRARRTAEIVGRDLEVSLTPVDELREFDVGPFEGVSDCGWVGEWRAGQEVPGVESFAKFRARIQRGIARALDLPGPVLIVAHGGVFWALESLTRLPGQSRLPNASLARFEPPSVADGSWLISITH